MKYSKKQLIKYRLDRAKEAMDDAEIIIRKQRWNSFANRLYYACFYVVSAYLTYKGIRAVTHSGLKSNFNYELVKSKKVSKQDGKLFNKLFALRQEADYEDFFRMDEETVTLILPRIKLLMVKIENLI